MIFMENTQKEKLSLIPSVQFGELNELYGEAVSFGQRKAHALLAGKAWSLHGEDQRSASVSFSVILSGKMF